jgi:hypothetical protein
MAKYNNFIVTKEFLDKNKDAIFVFGDNLTRKGYGGAAALRDHPQAYGFITKKRPDNHDLSFYRPHEYEITFKKEIVKLKEYIEQHPSCTFYISQLGGMLANKYFIWQQVIKSGLMIEFGQYPNVIFLWNEAGNNSRF